MTIKAGIIFDPNTLKIVSFANEWQNLLDAIITALDPAVEQVDNMDNDQKNDYKTTTNNNDNNATKKIGSGKFVEHYFVFYFTTWAYKKPFKFFAARCDVK